MLREINIFVTLNYSKISFSWNRKKIDKTKFVWKNKLLFENLYNMHTWTLQIKGSHCQDLLYIDLTVEYVISYQVNNFILFQFEKSFIHNVTVRLLHDDVTKNIKNNFPKLTLSKIKNHERRLTSVSSFLDNLLNTTRENWIQLSSLLQPDQVRKL